jgi:voltage-gated potassium channel
LITGVPFLTITVFGNIAVSSFALVIYLLEKDINPKINTYLDSLWWSFSTTTTVGYGDVVPITDFGKIIGIGLMLVGVAIFSIYTALFARAILDDPNYLD